jgi:hypothetical protein
MALPTPIGQSPNQGGGFKEFLVGKPGTFQRQERFSPQQGQLQNQAIAQTLQLLQSLGQQQPSFQGIRDLAEKRYQEKTIPSIAERFTRMGAQGSSAFGQELGQSGADLNAQLAALESQHGLQSRGQDMNLLSTLLGLDMANPYETFYEEPSSGFLQQSVIPSLAQLGGAYFSGGASLIPSLLSSLGGLFGKSQQGGMQQQRMQQPMGQQATSLTPQDLSQRLNNLQNRSKLSVQGLFPSMGLLGV